ncbi:hypothetical protein D9611_000428 [Ephemerocybe angulata]|uniref:F-box domain-containing protein n=1 Tax=Ephemerocybe angulata TaxID=980116 RepID=A0A8H5BN93_9AGAR|nr:hypothetical protein D9611_000428 [Tulosesus angulatus]
MSSGTQAAGISLHEMQSRQYCGFILLPRELIFKILEALDSGSVLACTPLSTYFNSAGVDVILRRNDVLDAGAYCRVSALVNATSATPPPDALAALLATTAPPGRVRHLHCTFKLSEDAEHLDEKTLEDPDILPASRLEITGLFALQRIGALLSKVDTLDRVTLDLSGLKHGLLSGNACPLLGNLIHTIIRKGCRTLEVKCKQNPFGNDDPWVFPIREDTSRSPPDRTCGSSSNILSRLSSICSLFLSGREEVPNGHRRLRSNSSSTSQQPKHLPKPEIHPHITKLDIDGSFFHPTGRPWMSDFLAYSPITDFTISLTSKSASSNFIDFGFKTLLQTVPRLQSLTVLNVDGQTIHQIIPRLRPFTALKFLTITLNSHLSSHPIVVQDAATPFTPGNVERLSISPGLIDYMILGTVTALKMTEFEIIYGRHAWHTLSSLCVHVKTVRDFYAKISVPMCISLTLSCMEDSWYANHDGNDQREEENTAKQESSPPWFITALESQDGADLVAVDSLRLELLPAGLKRGRLQQKTPCVDNICKLLSFFPGVKQINLCGPTSFRDDAAGALVVPKDVRQAVVQPVYEACSSLATLRIGEEVYPRPLVAL